MKRVTVISSIIATAFSLGIVSYGAVANTSGSSATSSNPSSGYNLGSKTVQGVAPQSISVQNSTPLVAPILASPTLAAPRTVQAVQTQKVLQVPAAPAPLAMPLAPPTFNMSTLSVAPEQRVVMTPGNELYANYFTFGLGGYSIPNQNIIILDYYKELPQYNLNTYFHAGHEAGGQTGNNSELTTDNMYLKGDWNNWTGIVSNTNNQNIIPNMYNNSQTYSVNNNDTNLYGIYHFMNNTPQPLNI
ncbi:MAG: hypothetical protein NTX05_07000 [Fusobacteria bacterium]|nr:hypothetical protein [Fusobacteriota bacterium]